MQKQTLTIVGGGLVGAMLANILAKYPFNIRLLEKRANPLLADAPQERGRSINLALSTRGWHALERIGLADEVRSHAIPMYARCIHTTDKKIVLQPYSVDNQAIFAVSRNILNKALLKNLQNFPNVKIDYCQKIISADIYTATVTTDKQETIKSDWLIGADGAFSAIQQAFCKIDRFSFSRQYISHSYKELTIPPDRNGNFVWNPNALHIFPRKHFMLIALPNPDKTFTATLFLDFEGETSFQNLQTPSAIASFFETHFSDFVEVAPSFVEEFERNPTSSLNMVNCQPWHQAKALLIGDAAHAIVPFYGQGMNAGFEDCTVLEAILQEYLPDINTAFQTFARLRKPDTDAITLLAQRNFIEMRDLVTDTRFLAKKELENQLVALAPRTWIPLYSLVTFSRIPYHIALQIGDFQNELLENILIQNISRQDAIDRLHAFKMNLKLPVG